jgi:hypothetical protein
VISSCNKVNLYVQQIAFISICVSLIGPTPASKIALQGAARSLDKSLRTVCIKVVQDDYAHYSAAHTTTKKELSRTTYSRAAAFH